MHWSLSWLQILSKENNDFEYLQYHIVRKTKQESKFENSIDNNTIMSNQYNIPSPETNTFIVISPGVGWGAV